jgi:hypothetical protein
MERGMPAQRVPAARHLAFVAHRQLVTTLRPAARQNLPAVLGRHSLAESVRVLPLSLVRLKRSLHASVLS